MAPTNGGGWVWGKTDYAGNARAIPQRPRVLRIDNFIDGTSNTILVGEKALDPMNCLTATWYWDEPYFTGGSEGTLRFGTKIIHDARGNEFVGNWGAAHSAGAQFVFADGSVRLPSYSSSSTLILALLTPDGEEVIPDF